MSRQAAAELLLLAALWGASFLFMRIGGPELGSFALVFVRVAGAVAVLLPILLWQGHGAALREHGLAAAGIGVLNSALPFLAFMVAAQVLSAGLMSVFNATTPIWTALIAWAWLGERPGLSRGLGLAIGLAGAAALALRHIGFQDAGAPATGSGAGMGAGAGSTGISLTLGVMACLSGPVLYGLSANLTRKYMAGRPPMVLAAGSQIGAALLVALPAWIYWPSTAVSSAAWGSAAALALLCTGLAYWLYFRLIARAGATSASTVTFLIPGFAMLWGYLALGEKPTLEMLLGCAVILVGTALATGFVKLPFKATRNP
jgi:drug/metabolite transporter (DMT)-like permease